MSAVKKEISSVFKSPQNIVYLSYLLLVLGIVAHVSHTYYFNFTQDDAFITFRYAANFLNGDGLVFNIGERVEGYTNFLWLILMILGKLAGIDYIIFSKIIGTLCGIGTIIVLFHLMKQVFNENSLLPGLSCLMLGLVYSFAYWSVSGLEIGAFSLAVLAAIYSYLRKSFLTAPILILATLIRPEGGLVFIFILLYDIISTKRISRYNLVLLSIYLLALIPYLVFKFHYFGGLFPNPFYAKTSFDLRQLINGLEYTGQYFWHYLGAGLFLIPLLLSIKKWKPSILFIVLFLFVYTVYIIIIGGDVLKVHRFFVPLMPLLITVIMFGLGKLFEKQYLIWTGVIIIISWQLYLPRQHVISFYNAEKILGENMTEMSNNLLAVDDSDFSLAASTIGIAGYILIGHHVIDLLGLTDSTIARHPEKPIEKLYTTWKETKYNSKYVLSLQPDYILFSTALKPSAPAERALFLYPQFLNSYRTIGFIYKGAIYEIYKKFRPVTGELRRSIDPEFVQLYNLGLNQMGAGKLKESSISFRKAWSLCPEPKYPYVLYHLAKIEMMNNNFSIYNQILDELVRKDTLMYSVYKDLFIIETNVKNNKDKAKKYRDRLVELVPWYIPWLDSFIAESQKRMNR
ncbi:MAG: hypothetical protein GY865_13885 [candidate division Zixibacteria bacterium]|nr:hypothetical protein [candidate division Zixibacteria bacterium]